MPSKSEKQRRFMEIASKDPKFAKKAGIDQDVAKEFAAADEAKPKRDRAAKINAMYHKK